MEEWKDVIGYEGRYQVSDLGRVKTMNYRRKGYEQLLKIPLQSMGYPCVRLSIHGEAKTRLVHHLVAEAFLNHFTGSYDSVIDHIDGNQENNNLNNLQIISQRDNLLKSNRKKRTSVYEGVCLNEGKWRAQIYINKKVKYLGLFDSEQEAHLAYINEKNKL